MKLAGEAGSLLKIEDEVAAAVAEAKTQWLAEVKQVPGQGSLFADLVRHEQQRMDFEVAEITDETFWERAEGSIYTALREYAEKAENGGGYQRRLFAEDAARGFAFIDICRQRYDVLVMNPPFGERPECCETYLQANFPETVGDFFSMFYERALHVVNERGKVGAITNRTWLSLPTFEGLRTRIFGKRGCVEVAADLGSFVLDAQVETAAGIIGRDVSSHRMVMWIRLLKTKSKHETLLKSIALANVGLRHETAFLASQQQFLSLPTSVYGYWMSSRLITLYHPQNSIGVRTAEVKQGTATADDFRFLRLAWEIFPFEIGLGKRWLRFAKGGEYAPFFDDVHLALLWKRGGAEIISWGYGRPQNTQYFGKAGITWPLRTTSQFGPRALPSGCAFGHKGPTAFPINGIIPNVLLGLLASLPARLLLSVRLGAGDDAPGSASKSYEVGLIRDLPFPVFSEEQLRILETTTARCIALARSRACEDDETTAYFITPILAAAEKTTSVRNVVTASIKQRDERFVESCLLSSSIDGIVSEALGFGETDKVVMWEELEPPVTAFDSKREPDTELFKQAYLTKDAIAGNTLPGGVEAENDVRVLTRRKQQIVLRDEETICRLFEITPQTFAQTRQRLSLLHNEDLSESIKSFLNYAAGCVFGRWDIRFATREKPAPELPDPFAPLPVCPPGMLQNAAGLPAAPSDVPASYPLRISWPGILVDDKGHTEDIERRVQEALHVIWPDRADAIEQEACEILNVKTLREYFRKPAGFFADHLKRYSKSRRQAPIYWPLSTKSSEYTLWLYYHRLNDQTLYSCVNNFVEPKLRQVSEEAQRLRAKGTGRNRDEEKEFEQLQDFELELQEFRDELLRLAKLPWRPNLNDGVQITAAPLWKLFRLPKWQKTLKETWQVLEKGDYDWAHLAMTIWPQRVVPKCTKDRSLAIAHELENLFWVEDTGVWRVLKSPKQEIEEQKRRQESAARKRVKQQLAEFAASEAGRLSADDVAHRLAASEWDDRELALLLYPQRMAEKCWEELPLVQKLGLKHPAKKTKAARDKFIKEIKVEGCAEIAPMLEAALSGRAKSLAECWKELENGKQDQLQLALALWPDRVVDKCAEDVSLAEEHGLRKFFWVQHAAKEWRRRETQEVEIANEVARRRGAAAGQGQSRV